MLKKSLFLAIVLVLLVTLPSMANGEPKVTEVFTNSSLRDALNTIAYSTGVNIFMDPSVEGVVTAEFKELPIEKALEKLLTPYGYTYKKMGNDYLVGTADPDSLGFKELSETEVVKLNYIPAQEAVNSLSDFFKPFIKVNEARNTVVISSSPEMINRIKQDLKKMDAPLKKVEIRLVSLEYSKEKKQAVDLSSLKAFFGQDLTEKSVYGVEVGDQLFGVSNKDSLESLLRLRLLSDLNQMRVTSDQKTMVLEGKTAEISRGRQGDIFVANENEDNYSVQKETVEAKQGVAVKIISVAENGDILLDIEGQLENIAELPEVTKNKAIWIDRRNINTTVLLKNYQTITIGTLVKETKKKEEGIASKYDTEETVETLFLLTAHVVGTEKPKELKVNIDKEANKFLKENKIEKEVKDMKTLKVGFGAWIPKEGDVSSLIEGEVRLSRNLELFGFFSKDDLHGLGLKYGQGIASVGIANVSSKDFSSFGLTAGLELGTDRFRVQGDYIYLPNQDEKNGVKVGVGVQF